MYHIYSDDGRILTSPKELEPLLKSSFSAFSKLIGHIRFFYMADEIWDGECSLIFSAGGKQLTAIALDDGVFDVHIAYKDFRVADETLLDAIFKTLKEIVPVEQHRPFEQITMNMDDPTKFPCGYRCDMCLGSKKSNENAFPESENFGYLNWLCFHNCVPNVETDKKIERWDCVFNCPGCASVLWKKECRYYICPTEKGYASCIECGEYHVCDVQRDSHYPGQANLGMTAEEVTNLVIPYCIKERFDIFRNSAL